jgi:hypothetical protein
MSALDNIVLWFHIGGFGLLMAAGAVEIAGMIVLLRTNVSFMVRVMRGMPKLEKWTNIPSVLILLVSGIYLSVDSALQGYPFGWIIVAFILFVIFASYMIKSAGQLETTLLAAEDGGLDAPITPEVREATLQMVRATVVGFTATAGILALMVATPSWYAAIVIAIVTLVVGKYLADVVAKSRKLAPQGPAPAEKTAVTE